MNIFNKSLHLENVGGKENDNNEAWPESGNISKHFQTNSKSLINLNNQAMATDQFCTTKRTTMMETFQTSLIKLIIKQCNGNWPVLYDKEDDHDENRDENTPVRAK